MLGLSIAAIRESLRSFRGAMLVQMQSMGLWTGRQFRVYRTFTVAQQFRFTCTKDFILSKQNLYTGIGSCQLQILTGSTPSGTWANVATQNAKNKLGTNTYVAANNVQDGGTFTGGTEREIIRADSGSGQGVSASSADDSYRVLPAGTYYFNLTVTGSTAGIYSFEWEELDTVNGV